eukprot:Plantae.Rhodophyta-Purpureofilum_apyrenoidigerum.ctg5362.p1 GENE.Plantae.Rhodophyta-Purpureofilum_apyrenoidigerum.ctg5362~~Plantae.Rhodophyta-Purpureofilum_apyrenoidigerum.ctg5362.p1  ORF type:complete len:325 (+),score=42.85 Plantae.Rhodophyta-Purpureofilum_apyrenoidigerum.ctg5362:167-1141(+)
MLRLWALGTVAVRPTLRVWLTPGVRLLSRDAAVGVSQSAQSDVSSGKHSTASGKNSGRVGRTPRRAKALQRAKVSEAISANVETKRTSVPLRRVEAEARLGAASEVNYKKVHRISRKDDFDESLDGDLADDDAHEGSATRVRSKSRVDEFLKEFGLQIPGDKEGFKTREDEPVQVPWDEEVHGPLEGNYPKPDKNGKFSARQIVQILQERRALQVSVINLKEKSSFAKHFVIATARSKNHQKNLANDIRKMYAAGRQTVLVQGQESDWLIVDGHDIIVHIMSEDARKFFNIEELWMKEISGVEGIEPAESKITEVQRRRHREQT